jgi:hemolysin activation/secretion protein
MLILAVTVGNAVAAPYPNSGRIYRDFKDDSFFRLPPQQQEVKPEVEPAEPPAEKGETIFVQGFEVHGNTLLEEARIQAVLSPHQGREMDAVELHEVAEELAVAYRGAGFFAARVYLPPQAITNGIVQLYVYEGFLEQDGIAFINSGERLNDDKVHSFLAANLSAGEVLTVKEVERTILLVNDLPGVNSRSTLYPGEEVGSAHFLMQVEDQPFISGNIDADNFGSYYTGEARLGATVYVNSPSRRGDQIVLRAVTSGSDSNYAFLEYNLPISGNGLRAGVSVDQLDYELGKQYRVLDAQGDAGAWRGFLAYPFLRGRHTNLFGRVEVSRLELEDKNNTGLLADRTIDSVDLILHGDHDDDRWADGVSYFRLAVTLGDLAINGNDAFKNFDDQSGKTEGSFTRFNLEFNRLQHLQGNLSSLLSLSGQLASQNLDSSQKFFIGGPFSVAGYPTGEAGGDEGALLHADLRYDFYDMPWRGNLQASVFYAVGWATLFKNTWSGWNATNPDLDNHIQLQSVGFGLTQTWDETFVLRGLLGYQVGSNETKDPTSGEAIDGSSENYRAWVQGIYYF